MNLESFTLKHKRQGFSS